MNEAWTGPHLQRFMQRIDYWSGGFTSRELELMYRAENGDFNWMYSKDGFPRAGYIKFWQKWGDWLIRTEHWLAAPARAFSTGTPPDEAPRPGHLWAEREKTRAANEAREQARFEKEERQREIAIQEEERKAKFAFSFIGGLLAIPIIIGMIDAML